MNLNKVITVVAGCSQDSLFNYACYMVDNLNELLPNFSVKKVLINTSDWEDWLENKCKAYGWLHTGSPIIWRETGVCGGNSTYIGGSSELKEFIKNYYGIDITLSEVAQKAIDLDYVSAENYKFRDKFEKYQSNVITITITGAGRSVCPDLVAQLAIMKELSTNGTIINLYDVPGHFFKMKDIVKDANAIGEQLRTVNVLEELSDGLNNCNILIILDHITREDSESTQSWLLRNYEATKEVAESINIYAPCDMKVIFCSMGPTCFCANVLVKESPKLNKNNVVAVSAHYGLEMMFGLLKSLDIDSKGIGCPPVWGFLGISQYVDIHHTFQKSSVYIPNKRALTSNADSTLRLGGQYTEFRWLLYLTYNKKPHEILATHKSICMYQVGRTEDFQKCKAICDLLKLWYQKDNINIEDQIITLGISSNGTCNIPKDVYFSQCVCMKILDDNSRIWIPCSEFPLPTEFNPILKNCAEIAYSILKDMKLIN